MTPDGRYLVVRGRLWRASNPRLSPTGRQAAVGALMEARRQVKAAMHLDAAALRLAREAVDQAKRRLGERGTPWWKDAAPDLNRRLVRNTPYAGWYASQSAGTKR
jgi:hypothetical protein